jgi:peptidoglycan/LPS O-acetylase OafA/YrhL
MTGNNSNPREPAPHYRPDIDGLRALAVLSVIGFHAFQYQVKGGFIGVDVFFVISGYLISTIIFNGLNEERFSFAEFYRRRVKRIFPALGLTLVAAFVAGWFLLLADDFGLLGRNIAGGAGFVSNLVSWKQAGYFDEGTDRNPLLHLWSLGIEEQFYFVWPALLWLAWKRRDKLPHLLGALIAVSFALNVYLWRADPTADFYSPLARFWELAAGAALALLHFRKIDFLPKHRSAQSFAGLALIGAALLGLDYHTTFPGPWALLPVAGAFLIISAGAHAWPNRKILSRPEAVWIGLISYPLYMWHWPLLAYARVVAFSRPSIPVRVAAVVVSVLLAWLTYRFVERPIRAAKKSGPVVAGLIAALCLILLVGAATDLAGGLPRRAINKNEKLVFLQHYDEFRRAGTTGTYREDCSFYDWIHGRTRNAISADCTLAGSSATYFLWGDSHAQMFSQSLRGLLPESVRLAQVASSMCSPSLGPASASRFKAACDASNAFALAEIRSLKPAVVFLAQRSDHELTDWDALAAAVHAAGGGRVVLFGPVPEWQPTLPLVYAKNYWGTPATRVKIGLDPTIFATDAALSKKYADSPNLTYISLASRLCDADGCLAVVPGAAAASPSMMAFDYGHLAPEGSAYVVENIIRPALGGALIFSSEAR